jgi:hypothetical protein
VTPAISTFRRVLLCELVLLFALLSPANRTLPFNVTLSAQRTVRELTQADVIVYGSTPGGFALRSLPLAKALR